MDKDEVTPERLYLSRRQIISNVGLGLVTAAGVSTGLISLTAGHSRKRLDEDEEPAPLSGLTMQAAPADDPLRGELTPYADITTYNNYYELGLDKAEPAQYASALKPRPWTVQIEGEVGKPRTIDIDTLISWFPLQERIYRMRDRKSVV